MTRGPSHTDESKDDVLVCKHCGAVFTPTSQRRQEEEHFFIRDRELIAGLRRRADAERRRVHLEQKKTQCWMRCPKCGDEMVEVEVGPVRLDQCRRCNGVYLDDGELEILRRLRRDSDFIARLMGSLKAGAPGPVAAQGQKGSSGDS